MVSLELADMGQMAPSRLQMQEKVNEVNKNGNLHIQLVTNEPKAQMTCQLMPRAHFVA